MNSTYCTIELKESLAIVTPH